MNKPLSKQRGTTIESLRNEGYKAIFVGIGEYRVICLFYFCDLFQMKCFGFKTHINLHLLCS